jgi:hypothetical protein
MHRTRPIIHTWPQIAPWPNLTCGCGICNRVFAVTGGLCNAARMMHSRDDPTPGMLLSQCRTFLYFS